MAELDERVLEALRAKSTGPEFAPAMSVAHLAKELGISWPMRVLDDAIRKLKHEGKVAVKNGLVYLVERN